MTKLTLYILIAACIGILFQVEYSLQLLTNELKTANNKIQIAENKVAELKREIVQLKKQ